MKIIQAKPLPGYRLELRFENGEGGAVDLSSFVGKGVFEAWDDPQFFNRVNVTCEGNVEWPGDLDLCADSLYLRMTGKTAEEVFPTLGNQMSHA